MTTLSTDKVYGSTGHIADHNEIAGRLLRSTDYASIAAAITACSAAGGGTVYIPSGSYAITESLTLPSNVKLRGDGETSIITTNSDIEMIVTSDGAQFPKIEDLLITNTLAGQTKVNIHGVNSNGLKVMRVQINNASTGSGGGILVDDGAGGFASGYYTEIAFSKITHGGIEIHQTDAKLYKNWIFAQNRTYAIYLKDCGNISVDGCDFIGGIGGAGIYAVSSEGTKIHDCLSGSNVAEMDCGISILLDASYYSVVSNNYFFNTTQDAVVLKDMVHGSVIGNSFINGNSFDNGASDIVISGDTISSNLNIIMGNSHKITAARTDPGYCIEERNSGELPTRNVILGNVVSGNYLDPYIFIGVGSLSDSSHNFVPV